MKSSIATTSGLAAALFALSGLATAAVAQTGPGAPTDPAMQSNPRYEGRSVQRSEDSRYDRSGTAGRLDLGADPAHPEGPGNVSGHSR